MTNHLLSWILFVPAIGAGALLFIPGTQKNLIRWLANLFALLGFGVSLLLLPAFDKSASGYQFVERATWIPSLGASYLIGIDGISLLLVMLTTVMGVVAILSSWNAIQDRVKEYYILFLLQQTGMLGVFMGRRSFSVTTF